MEQYSPRALINFAAESHVDRSIKIPFEFIQTNVNGTHALLEASTDFFVNNLKEDANAFRFFTYFY